MLVHTMICMIFMSANFDADTNIMKSRWDDSSLLTSGICFSNIVSSSTVLLGILVQFEGLLLHIYTSCLDSELWLFHSLESFDLGPFGIVIWNSIKLVGRLFLLHVLEWISCCNQVQQQARPLQASSIWTQSAVTSRVWFAGYLNI
jgi:hypothetical protein